MKLTEKETQALKALVYATIDGVVCETVQEYRENGEGWFCGPDDLYEMIPNKKVISGIFSSLMEKKMVYLYEKRGGMLDLYCVTESALDWYQENFEK